MRRCHQPLDSQAQKRTGAGDHPEQDHGGKASQQYDLPLSEFEQWVRGVYGAWRTPGELPRRACASSGSKDLQETGEAMLELRARKIAVAAKRGQEGIETTRPGQQAEGVTVSIAKVCRWLGMPRRTMHYK
ncbi:Uncharacterised protein [Achromobacter kerstersii]|nr:hypothetical protein [Achromobacter kerstersii]CUJ74745.1 Uncharacterised protein [Achromobacter kerstersii]